MPYSASVEGSTKAPFLAAVFPLRKGALWGQEIARAEADVVSVPRSVALSEPLEKELIWRESGASIVRFRDREVQMLEELYVFRRRMEVLRFLDVHPFLVPLLLEAYAKIGRYFEPYHEVFLEVISDPEATNDRQLFAFIGTRLSPDQALDSLERFDEEWWLDVLDQAQGKLCIDVEFL